mmetsp:Transcript_2064/g.6008  ORF Transcript_2064/g.6008 Transcript_2064/m.6008 type:complete len:429 (+) Transcript_2064:95-1381(+)
MFGDLREATVVRWAEAFWNDTFCCGDREESKLPPRSGTRLVRRPPPEAPDMSPPASAAEGSGAGGPQDDVGRAFEPSAQAPARRIRPVRQGSVASSGRSRSISGFEGAPGRRRSQDHVAGGVVEVPVSSDVHRCGLTAIIGYSARHRKAQEARAPVVPEVEEESDVSSVAESLQLVMERSAQVLQKHREAAAKAGRMAARKSHASHASRTASSSTMAAQSTRTIDRADSTSELPPTAAEPSDNIEDNGSAVSKSMSRLSFSSVSSTGLEDALDAKWSARKAAIQTKLDENKNFVPFERLAAAQPDGTLERRQQAKYDKKFRDGIGEYHRAMVSRLQKVSGAEEVDRFAETADPAKAVIEGVLRYHRQCHTSGKTVFGESDQGSSSDDDGQKERYDPQKYIHQLEDTFPREPKRTGWSSVGTLSFDPGP